jgi:hypothetical protein
MRDQFERREERAAGVREAVGNGERWALSDGPGYESRIDELAETLGEHRVADPVYGARERAEPCRPASQCSEDHSRPALSEEVERANQRGIRARALVR